MAEPAGLEYIRFAIGSIEVIRRELLNASKCILESGVGDAETLATDINAASKLVASVQIEVLNHWIAMISNGSI